MCFFLVPSAEMIHHVRGARVPPIVVSLRPNRCSKTSTTFRKRVKENCFTRKGKRKCFKKLSTNQRGSVILLGESY